ncbi:nucleotidyltransferase domain-containing protein [Microvirga sp. GCM10011540]|uniref:nucleotidyltransferase domain-containing protein n=1 Tax=Microvirga sp. GCM10011540 TaxID=3317338 RepID=UPI0036242BC5
MTADEYLHGILKREAVDTGPFAPVRGCQTLLLPHLREWAGGQLVSVSPSGSFAKGTANASGTDIDLFISLKEDTRNPLGEIYDSLFEKLRAKQLSPRRQNVSIGVRIRGFDVDLVPARRQGPVGEDHSLYRNRADTWTKTNVARHIALVASSGRRNEIRVLKLWRNQKNLDFPSFYLELTAIEALKGGATGSLSTNILQVFEYLRDRFETARVIDPANTNNVLSDELTQAAKAAIRQAATDAIRAAYWEEIVQ